jgi:alkylresorcinol/alkylpyrone synthase
MDYCRANPKHNALVIAVELCSLTFQKDDLSKSNIIASSLFSDGCAAALVCGDESRLYNNKGVELMNSMSTIYPDSLDVMGWGIIENGFKVLFSRDIPTIVKQNVKPNIEEFLDNHHLSLKDIKHYIAHPGGAKVIKAYMESLSLPECAFKYSRKVLSEHGNMSSPSVLYVMKEFLNNGFNPGEYGLIAALGPGFSSELILFKTS